MKSRIFDTKNVILTQISEDDLESFLVDFDFAETGQPEYMLEGLTKAIINTIPEYVFAYHSDSEIPLTETIERVRQAAKSIYKIEEYDLMRRAYLSSDELAKTELENKGYINRGEFGELILHLLLREFHNTIPLISKVYFKDSANVPAHGFDAVHVSEQEKVLWLGESKFYTDGRQGVKALLDDLEHHFTRNYLEDQAVVIKKNLDSSSMPQRDKWIENLNSAPKVKELLPIVNIPLLCVFQDDIYSQFHDFSDSKAIDYHEMGMRELKQFFDLKNSHPLKSQLNVVLLLFPVRDKKELVTKLHERLWHMQNT
jgi:hypothetical protein